MAVYIDGYYISDEVERAVKLAASSHRVPAPLLFAIAARESGFNTNAVNKSWSYSWQPCSRGICPEWSVGLFQLNRLCYITTGGITYGMGDSKPAGGWCGFFSDPQPSEAALKDPYYNSDQAAKRIREDYDSGKTWYEATSRWSVISRGDAWDIYNQWRNEPLLGGWIPEGGYPYLEQPYVVRTYPERQADGSIAEVTQWSDGTYTKITVQPAPTPTPAPSPPTAPTPTPTPPPPIYPTYPTYPPTPVVLRVPAGLDWRIIAIGAVGIVGAMLLLDEIIGI